MMPHGVDSGDRAEPQSNQYERPNQSEREGTGRHDPPIDSGLRQRRIVEIARGRGGVEVASLADELNVAVETIRRDLRVLDDRGVLRRIHGGAVAVEGVRYESDVQHRSEEHIGEKRRIARAAAGLLNGAETVYIDEGYTPRLVAEELDTDRGLTVVTSSLLAARVLAEDPNVTLLMLGGRMRSRTLATVDHWALRMLSDLTIDLAFLGSNGISRDRGLTTPDPAVAAVKQAAVARSRRRVFVGTHTKFGVTTFCRFADVVDFETLVTGTELAPREATRYSALGPRLLRV
jgi:DeoR family fructose operon transcriptional repressor